VSSTCKTCHRPIRWERTAKGHAIPLDPLPTVDGNLVVEEGIARGVDPLLDSPPWFTSHFATCPQANLHRRKRP